MRLSHLMHAACLLLPWTLIALREVHLRMQASEQLASGRVAVVSELTLVLGTTTRDPFAARQVIGGKNGTKYTPAVAGVALSRKLVSTSTTSSRLPRRSSNSSVQDCPERRRGHWKVVLNNRVARPPNKCSLRDRNGKRMCNGTKVFLSVAGDSCMRFVIGKVKSCSPADLKCKAYNCKGMGVLRLETVEGVAVDPGTGDKMLSCGNEDLFLTVEDFCPGGKKPCDSKNPCFVVNANNGTWRKDTPECMAELDAEGGAPGDDAAAEAGDLAKGEQATGSEDGGAGADAPDMSAEFADAHPAEEKRPPSAAAPSPSPDAIGSVPSSAASSAEGEAGAAAAAAAAVGGAAEGGAAEGGAGGAKGAGDGAVPGSEFDGNDAELGQEGEATLGERGASEEMGRPARVAECPAAHPESVVVVPAHAEELGNLGVKERLGPPFNRCALVGSAAAMKGSKLGKTIDGFDTVIRVNRLPTPASYGDFGQKTDVYFKNTIGDYNGTHVLVRFFGERGKKSRDAWCELVAGGPACPFTAVLYEGWKDPSIWNEMYSNISLGHQSDALQYFQHQVESLGLFNFPNKEEAAIYKVRPSGGMKAFFTSALLCSSLQLFGFGGRGSVDSHVLVGHDFDKEHAFLDRIAAGEAQEDDFPAYPGGSFSEEALSFGSRLACLSRAGLIGVKAR